MKKNKQRKMFKNNKQKNLGARQDSFKKRRKKKRINHDVLFDFSIHQVEIKESPERNAFSSV